MNLVAVSAIQVWTLVVAGAAVLASLGGILIGVYSARKIAELQSSSEHNQWVRDNRARVYGELLTQVQRRQDHFNATVGIGEMPDFSGHLVTLGDIDVFGGPQVKGAARHLNLLFASMWVGLRQAQHSDDRKMIWTENYSEVVGRTSALRGAMKNELGIPD